MKNIFKQSLPTILVLLFLAFFTYGATLLAPFQGGTGKDSSIWTGCVQTTAGVWSTTTCGGVGGGATTTINGVSGPTFTFATTSETNLGLIISTSTGQVMFTPTWIGTLADARITSASNWNTAYGWNVPTNYLATGTAASTYLPIVATADVDLGVYNLKAVSLYAQELRPPTGDQAISVSAIIRTLDDVSGNAVLDWSNGIKIQKIGTGENALLDPSLLTTDKTFTFPDASGTFALQGWATSTFVPYTGATADVDLGGYTLSADNIIVGNGPAGGDLYFAGSGYIYGLYTYQFDFLNLTKTITGRLDFSNLTVDRDFTFPDASGTFALTSDILASSTWAKIANNLYDLQSTSTARTNLGLGSIALLSSIDISSNTNLAFGRSITGSGDSIEADAELYTDTKCLYWESPVATDDFKSIWRSSIPITFTKIWAESDQTVTFDLQEDDGSPADIIGTDIAPAAGETSTTTFSDANIAADSRIDLAITSVANTPTWVSICFDYTKDD